MARYHVTAAGNPAICKATVRPCPLGGQHYGTLAAAETAASLKADVLKNIATSRSKKMTADIAKVWSDTKDEVYALSTKEAALLKSKLRNEHSLKEIERMGLTPSTPVHTYFVHNMDATFDYNESATQRVFTKGACGYLAYALREKTGKPVTVFTSDSDSEYWEGHVALKLSDDEYLDVTGIRTLQDIQREFSQPGKRFSVDDFHDDGAYKDKMKLDRDENFYVKLPPLEKAILDRVSRDLVRDYI